MIRNNESSATGNSVVVNYPAPEKPAISITGTTIKGNNNSLNISYNPAENEYLKEQIRLLKQLVKMQKQEIKRLKK